jgi:alginate O-acetyltransferase complex protein AlgI
MLFCSSAFVLFFAVVWTAYWGVRRPWLAVALFLAALGLAEWAGVTLFPEAAKFSWTTLCATVTTGAWPWLAGLVVAAAVLGPLLGPDRARVWLLLLASFYFYACWNKWLALLICVSTAVDYLLARGMDGLSSARLRRLLLAVSLVGNLGLLCYFKYANFFLHSLEEALHALGASASLPLLSVLLPVGISFYTFEAINYTVDVYRRRVPAERDLGHFMLFILFFPHLVAGPIVRARDFLPQVRRRKRWSWGRMHLGCQFLLMGLFKKLAIADHMALFADPVFNDPAKYSTTATWIAVLAYAIQIYCDFSGYTDMALGAAHLLGYKLARNFNMPYWSLNISEFWRRWHISLSSWLRDYLFIPLGGSRGSNWQTNRNLLITMTLGGLWHGASWTFVLWGVLHGVLLIVHRGFRAVCEQRPRLEALLQTAAGTVLRVGLTFGVVMLAWVLFRASDFSSALTVFEHLFSRHAGLKSDLHDSSLWQILAVLLVCHGVARFGLWRWAVERLPAPALGLGYAVVLTLALLLTPDAGKAFIYFQF